MTESSSETPNEEELRKLFKPDPTVEQILEVVRSAFVKEKDGSESVDIQVIKELESYDDKNLWIRFEGNDWLVKVHNGVESKDLIDKLEISNAKRKHEESSSSSPSSSSSSSTSESYKQSAIHLQNAMMMHLREHGITTNYPQNPDRGDFVSAPTPVSVHALPVVSKEHSPSKLVVRLLSWVDGRPMSAFPMLPLEALADAGRFLGKLSVCLSSLKTNELAACKRYHQWDGKNTADLRDFVQYIDDEQRKEMVTSVIDSFQSELIDSKVAQTSFQKALIHGDFNDANFLLDDNFCVSGVIDFGDSVESWRILDLSVAMAYSMLTVYGKQGRSLSAAAAVLRGYNAVCPLTKEERQHLLLLIACRLSCSVTLGAFSYQQNPGNEYLLLHATPGWKALELIWGTDVERRASMRKAIDGMFDRACSKSGVSEGGTPIDCSDLAFPDPSINDPLADVRA